MKRTLANRRFPTVGTMYDSLPKYIFFISKLRMSKSPPRTSERTDVYKTTNFFFFAKSLKSNLMTSHHSGYEHDNWKLSIGKTLFVFFSI
jgi:hypothetical protein